VIGVNDGLIGRIRVAQPADKVTRVVLETKAGSSFWDNLEENPHRLVIEVRSPEAAQPSVQPKPGIVSAPVPSEQTKLPHRRPAKSGRQRRMAQSCES
jgi:hypothetical protein